MTPRRTALQVRAASVYTFNHVQVHRRMKRAKLFVSGGGSLIQDATSNRSLWFYLYCIWTAHRKGCRVMMYGCGIGPVKRKLNRWMAAKILNACVDLIALRDPDSALELEKLGVTRPERHVTADPALLQTVPEGAEQNYIRYCKAAGLETGGKYCLFALRPWGTAKRRLAAFASAAEYSWKAYGMMPVFFLLEPDKDREITQAVAELVHCPKLLLPPVEDGEVICALMRDMHMVVSMRLHALIFASGQGTPVVGISYDPKVSGFMDYLGQGNYIGVEEVTGGTLCDLIDSAAASKSVEVEIVARLRELAGQNGGYAWRLLQEEAGS